MFCKIKDIYNQQKKQHTQTNAILNRKNKKNNKTVIRKSNYESWGKFIQTHLKEHIPCKAVTQYVKTRIFIAKKFTENELRNACMDFTTAHFLALKASVIDKNHWIHIAQTEYVLLQDIQSHISGYVCGVVASMVSLY